MLRTASELREGESDPLIKIQLANLDVVLLFQSRKEATI